MDLINLSELSSVDVRSIWRLVDTPSSPVSGTVAWSFEGNGIRTRSTFIHAFRALGLEFIELPNLLKTEERARDLAGYLDPLYDFYVIRESNHARLAEFAATSRRPVINAMSSEGHPCEVLADAYFIDTALSPIERVRICLWGPPTNVFRSWHELAVVLGLDVVHICQPRFHEVKPNVTFLESPGVTADIVITDGWLKGVDASGSSLTQEHLAQMGNPKLLPTPPFALGREISFDPLTYEGFVGYEQKALLSAVQAAILQYVAQDSRQSVSADNEASMLLAAMQNRH
ncbi:ornithine carbamoyltransferase [Caballeronia sordidicola]|uniref:ornithine carbamoyltransferase n=1 Tax=Caballeronia sordidicola TaxID=196367 RepID=UPI0007C682F4|nr:ornithine carbamoyltransferase [Caballeronia sordidicola]